MREELEKMVSAGKLGLKHVEPLVELTTSGFCTHRSWGFGKITTVDTVFARFTIDFTDKPGHQMDLGFAAESLKPIPSAHILARKSSDLEGLRRMAALNHLELIKVVLDSYGGQATSDQIQSVLVPDVISEDWRKWWEAARKEMKKDGHFRLPTKKSEPVVFTEVQMSLQDRALEDFQKAKGLKARIAIAGEMIKSLADLTDPKVVAEQVVPLLNEDIGTHQRTQLPTALEAVFVRDELKKAAEMASVEGEVHSADLWAMDPQLEDVLAGIPATKHKIVLQSLKEAKPDKWVDIVLFTMNQVPAKQVGECANLLIAEEKMDVLKASLVKTISRHTAATECLLWLAKAKGGVYDDILGAEVFRAMLTSMERDQFNEKKSNRLADYILKDANLMKRLIGEAHLDVVKDLTRALQFSPVFDDMDKRSLLARIVKMFPKIQSLISKESTRQDTTLVASWKSIEKKKAEYDDLIKNRLPANRQDIEIARSYGDLRENHEFKAAKEEQKRLSAYQASLESELDRARGTDFATVRTDVVSIGTKVVVTDLATNEDEVYLIMGAFDSDPDNNVVSYLTPLPQALINNPVGAEVEFRMGDNEKKYRIKSISPALPTSTVIENPGESK